MDQSFPYVPSYWMMNQSTESAPPLSGDHTTDVVIVGGGVAGLSTALGLVERQPELRVSIIEARHIGFGASGRNGGVLISMPPAGWMLQNLSDEAHLADVRMAVSMTTERLNEVGTLLQEEGIDAEWNPTQIQTVARNFFEVASIRWAEELIQAAGLATRFYEGAEAQARIGYPAKAVLAFPVVTVQPYKLVRGLRTLLMRRGVSIFEDTPATSLETTAQGVTVRTPQGVVRASKAVLTTNAYLARTEIELGVELPKTSLLHTYLMATEPLTDEQLNRISPTGEPFGDPALAFMYGRLHDRRLLFGGVDRKTTNTLQDDQHERSFRYLHRHMVRRFPFLADVRLAAAWGGAVQQNAAQAPIVQRVAKHPNLVLNMGYGGNSGVGAGLLSGRLVPSLVLDQVDDADARHILSRLAKSRFPIMGPVRAATGVLGALLRGGRRVGMAT